MIIGIEAAAAVLRNAPPGNGGGSGTITGVRFDNSAVDSGLTVASQSVTDSPLLTISMWFRSTDVSFWPSLVGLAKYPIANYSNVVLGLNNEGDIGGGFKTLNGAKLLEFSTAGSIVGSNETHHLFISADTNHAAAAKVKAKIKKWPAKKVEAVTPAPTPTVPPPPVEAKVQAPAAKPTLLQRVRAKLHRKPKP